MPKGLLVVMNVALFGFSVVLGYVSLVKVAEFKTVLNQHAEVINAIVAVLPRPKETP